MKKRRPGPPGKGDRQFLRDSGKIRSEIKKAKGALAKCGTEDQKRQVMARIENAQGELLGITRARFENIAQQRTTTALRAMDEIVKLTAQHRYASILTMQHAQSIITLLQQRFDAVSAALTGTVESYSARRTVGIVAFGEFSIFQADQAAE